jgi:hypothetical protein
MSERFEDEEIEGFLRRFEPRAPSALPRRPRHRQRPAWWAVAAALVVGGVWLGLRRPAEVPPDVAAPVVTRPRATMGELSVLLRPGESPRAIEELGQRVLADPRRSGGALRELARGGGGF